MGAGAGVGVGGGGASSEASVVPGPPGAVGGGAQWGAFVLLLLLGLVVAYCCWGAPCCRGCCCRPRKTPAAPNARAHHQDAVGTVSAVGSARTVQGEDVPCAPCAPCTPTIILLPQGRMLVVDGAVLSSLQADASGLDLIRLGENLVRAQHRHQDASILDAEAGLAGLGLAGLAGLAGLKEAYGARTLDGGPPTYEELFGLASASPPPCPSPQPLPLPSDDDGAPSPSPLADALVTQQQPPSYEELVVGQVQRASVPSTRASFGGAPSDADDEDSAAGRPAGSQGQEGASLASPSRVVPSPAAATDADQSIRESRV